MGNNCDIPRSFICKLNTYAYEYPDEGKIDENKAQLGTPLDCPEGWETHPNSWHCFHAAPYKMQRAEADRKCKAQQAYLVTVYDDPGNAYIQELMTSSPEGHLDVAWIGAQTGPNGEFEWDDKSTMIYHNFDTSGNPNTGDCAYIDGMTGKWIQADCSE